MSRHRVRFHLNGHAREVEVEADRLLLDVLRDECALTGTKEGCRVGICGTCTVLVDGRPISACLFPAVNAEGATVRTIEGIAAGGELTALQRAFIEHGGFQCGICTPGQILSATALLEAHPRPTDEQIREWMMGNLCRCTGYYGIARAIQSAQGAPPPSTPASSQGALSPSTPAGTTT